jgi:hypothetical protein
LYTKCFVCFVPLRDFVIKRGLNEYQQIH